MNKSTTKFHRIPNPIVISLAGRALGSDFTRNIFRVQSARVKDNSKLFHLEGTSHGKHTLYTYNEMGVRATNLVVKTGITRQSMRQSSGADVQSIRRDVTCHHDGLQYVTPYFNPSSATHFSQSNSDLRHLS